MKTAPFSVGAPRGAPVRANRFTGILHIPAGSPRASPYEI